MKKVLIVYSKMVTGGSTTALISLLNEFEYSEYKVDLLLLESGGELFESIPSQVNVLPPVFSKVKEWIFYPFMKYKFLTSKNHLKAVQKFSKKKVLFGRSIKDKYDITISFLELAATYYLVEKVSSNYKIAWVHVDIKSIDLDYEIEKEVYKKVDKIVLVSEKCQENFNEIFPYYKKKTLYIENIVSERLVKKLSLEVIPEELIEQSQQNIIMTTVCRIDNSSKALDRMIEVFSDLKKLQIANNLIWWIIGDGPDFNKLEKLIADNNIKNIILLGNQKNPYKYLSKSHFFLLPSKYEGKPVSVTEAMILGIPPVVTRYSSAEEQINDKVNGLILENSYEGLFSGLKNLLLDINQLDELKAYLEKERFNNDIKKIYDLIS